MQRFAIYLMAVVGGLAFLFMVKLMADMTDHMGRMTDQVTAMSVDLGRMRGQMETLTVDVAGIRTSVETMAGVVRTSGEQIQRLNPMEMMQQMVPPGVRR